MTAFSWALSVAATLIYLAAIWLYGDGNRYAPCLGLLLCLCWVVYDVMNEQWPLLVPTAMNVAVTLRNLKRMWGEP